MATKNIEDAFQLSAEKRYEIRQGRLLLHHFFSILRTALYHASNNEAMLEPSKSFVAILKWFLDHEQGQGAIIVSQGLVFAGSMRVRIGARQTDMVRDLEKFLSRRHVGGLTFQRPLNEEEVRKVATLMVNFSKPTVDKDGVPGLTKLFEDNELQEAVAPIPPSDLKLQKGFEDIIIQSETGRNAERFVKTHTVMSTMLSGDSALARSGVQRMVRSLSDVKGESSDSMIGLSIISAVQNMSMRSMIVLLVALKLAKVFEATRESVAVLGDVIVELAVYDEEAKAKAKEHGFLMAGLTSLLALLKKKDLTPGVLRHQLVISGRYLPSLKDEESTFPLNNRMSEIIRISSDYVDLITPTPMSGAEPIVEGGPMAPHEALFKLRDVVGERYTEEVFAGLVKAVGLLPVGTAIETEDGRSCVIVKQTADPLLFIGRDMITLREWEVGFVKGSNCVVKVSVGADLLQERSETLLGGDYNQFERLRQRVELMALGV